MKQQIYTLRQQKQQNINENNTKIPVLLMNLIHKVKVLIENHWFQYSFMYITSHC